MPKQPGDTVVEMFRHALRGDHEGMLGYLHPEVEFKPHDSDVELHGHDAMRRRREGLAPELRDAEWMPLSLWERGDTVLSHGYARIQHPQPDGTTEVEYLTPCWVMRVEDGLITSLAVYTSFNDGVAASGITPERNGRRELGTSGWLFSRALRRIAAALAPRPVLAPR